jgi:hypothetical protein
MIGHFVPRTLRAGLPAHAFDSCGIEGDVRQMTVSGVTP